MFVHLHPTGGWNSIVDIFLYFSLYRWMALYSGYIFVYIALYKWMEQYSGHISVLLHHTDGWNGIVDMCCDRWLE